MKKFCKISRNVLGDGGPTGFMDLFKTINKVIICNFIKHYFLKNQKKMSKLDRMYHGGLIYSVFSSHVYQIKCPPTHNLGIWFFKNQLCSLCVDIHFIENVTNICKQTVYLYYIKRNYISASVACKEIEKKVS